MIVIMRSTIGSFLFLFVFAFTVTSCEKDNLETDNTVLPTSLSQITLPSGKVATVSPKGYLVFLDPSDFVEEVNFLNEKVDEATLAMWNQRFISMLSVASSIESRFNGSEDMTFEQAVGSFELSLYTQGEALRPAQSNRGFSALLNSQGIVQVGDQIHLLSDRVQISGAPGLEASIINQYSSNGKHVEEGLIVISQEMDRVDMTKTNSKPMSCPTPGVAHRDYRDPELVVGEVFTNSYRYQAGLSFYHHLNWFINAYNYTTTRNRRSEHKAIGNLEITPKNLTISGGLFSGSTPQDGFQVAQTFNTTQLKNQVDYFQFMLKSQMFTTTRAFDMRTLYTSGQAFIGRQGEIVPGVRLGVVLFCQ
ncbi:hypothetical protein [Neolewinella sp.]|uniref:hypothetical protein n=1 Tax=Neolewinella sp. TaxID=2993543 RepID=UPI003B52DFCD